MGVAAICTTTRCCARSKKKGRWAEAGRRTRAFVDPGLEALIELAKSKLPAKARVLVVSTPPVTRARLPDQRLTMVPAEDAVAFFEAYEDAPFDAIVLPWPSQQGSLIRVLSAAQSALASGGHAFACDLVWQTAPSVELLAAFAPMPGKEKVRPIEGYEMQVEHSGFEVLDRDVIDRTLWAATLGPEQRAAVEADSRGAARAVAWVLVAVDA